MDGPEYEKLGEVAQKHKIFLSGNAYELDPNFPQLYFQTCFIIDPSGDVILRYRRLVSMFAPTPHDVLDKYLDIYGQEEDKKIFFQVSIYDPDIRLFVNWSPLTRNVIEMKLIDK